MDKLLADPSVDIASLLACEWKLGEYARDAAKPGYEKTMIAMGHIGSECAGMRHFAKKPAGGYRFEIKFFIIPKFIGIRIKYNRRTLCTTNLLK